MEKITSTMLTSILGILLFSCQSEMTGTIKDNVPVPVSIRATPSDAIELTATDGMLVIEGGKNYVVRGNVTAAGFSSTTSSSSEATLYIEGKLTIGSSDQIDFPDGVNFIISDGGTLDFDSPLVTLGSNSSLYIEKEGKFLAIQLFYGVGTTNSVVVNYGIMSVTSFYIRDTPFYNMPTGIAVFCGFTSFAEVQNLGEITFCRG